MNYKIKLDVMCKDLENFESQLDEFYRLAKNQIKSLKDDVDLIRQVNK